MSERAIVTECSRQGMHLCLEAHPMGADWNVMITGGERPHIGAAALGQAYQRPDGHWTAGASVLAVGTHKEDVLARQAALLLARRTGRTVLVSCGIHVDNLSPQGIADFVALAEEGVENLSRRLTGLDGETAAPDGAMG